MITPRTAATTRLSTRTRSALVVAVLITIALIGSAAAQAPVSTFGLGSSQLREAQLAALPLALAALPSSDLTRESFVTPLPGHTRLSSGFGWRNLAVNGNRFHAGIDLPAAPGTPVRAARDGVVVRAGWWGTYGYAVAVDHQDGSETRYAHLSAFSVAAGETVRQGDVIGAVGSTGASTGPHLHFELRFDERAVDPTAYLDNDPLRARP